LLDESGLLEMQEQNQLQSSALNNFLLDENRLTALYIPADFSEKLKRKANQISQILTFELGFSEKESNKFDITLADLDFYHDPVLQENYSYSITNVISSFLNVIENELMIESIYSEAGIEKSSNDFKAKIMTNKIVINRIPAAITFQK